MPLDTKRLPVPEDSCHPSLYSRKEKVKETDIRSAQRPNGRKQRDVRPIYVNIGINSEARGSAYLELGNTKLLCTVHGPREVTRREDFSLKGQLLCEFKYAPFSRRLRQPHIPTSEEKEISRVIQQALEPAVMLEKFPKARFDIFVIVLEDDGSALASAITCSSMALVNAGIPMYDIVIGASLIVVDDVILLDPVSEEESVRWKSQTHNNGLVVVGYLPNLNQLSACDQKGILESSMLQKSICLGIEMCKRIHPVLDNLLKKSVEERLKEENI